MDEKEAALRRRAKDLVDELDEADVDEAVAYLTRLRDAEPNGRGLMATIGLTSTQKGAGRSTMEVTVAPHLMNPHGVLHGAVLFAAMDTAMGGALTSLLAEGETCATVEAKINYLAPVVRGRLTAEATVVNKGRRVAVVEARATMEDGRPAAVMLGTFVIQRRKET